MGYAQGLVLRLSGWAASIGFSSVIKWIGAAAIAGAVAWMWSNIEQKGRLEVIAEVNRQMVRELEQASKKERSLRQETSARIVDIKKRLESQKASAAEAGRKLAALPSAPSKCECTLDSLLPESLRETGK